MEWTATYDERHDVVRVVVKGRVGEESADRMLRELVQIARAHNCSRFLLDDTGAELAMSLSEIRRRPQHYAEAGIEASARLAVVFSEWTPDAVLLEATIEGSKVHRRVFVDVDEALAWLKSERP
jgi:hypothetical protein